MDGLPPEEIMAAWSLSNSIKRLVDHTNEFRAALALFDFSSNALKDRSPPPEQFVADSPLEERGFEPSVPLVPGCRYEMLCCTRRLPLLRLIGLAAARFRELDPAGGDQAIGILDGHLDDAILADGDMPARQGLQQQIRSPR